MPIVRGLRGLPGHAFWPDHLSMVDCAAIDTEKVLTSAQVTDTYLLALAKEHGGVLATFDRKLSALAVKGGKPSLHLIKA